MIKKIKKFIQRIRNIIRIADTYDKSLHDIAVNYMRISNNQDYLDNLVKELTRVDFDVSPRISGTNLCIMSGRYRNTDYVQIFSMHDQEFVDVLKWILELKKRGQIDRVDSPIHMRAVFDREGLFRD